MRLAVFGGTFDPPHLGHLIVAQDACLALALDRVLFVPAHIPPHKRESQLTPAPLRLEMLRAAVEDNPAFAVSTLELDRPGPSFTVDTLRALRDGSPGAELFLLLGADQVRELHAWRSPEELARLARLVVFSRAGEAPETRLPVACTELPVTRIDISATEIRRRVAEAQPVHYLVPAAVERIIAREGLYRIGASRGV